MSCPRCGGPVGLAGSVPSLASCDACSIVLLCDPIRMMPACASCGAPTSVVPGKLPTTVMCDACDRAYYVRGTRAFPAPRPTFPIEPPACPECSRFLGCPTDPPPVGTCGPCEKTYLLDPTRAVPPCPKCGGSVSPSGDMPLALDCATCGHREVMGEPAVPTRQPDLDGAPDSGAGGDRDPVWLRLVEALEDGNPTAIAVVVGVCVTLVGALVALAFLTVA